MNDTTIDLDAPRKLATEAVERAGKATPGWWRAGAVQKDRVFCHYANALEGPNGERTLLRFNEHFPHEADAQFVEHSRADVPLLGAAVLALVEEVERRTAERDEARSWVRRLTATQRVLTCAFCGEAYPPGTPESNDDALTAHVRVCAKHPMRATEAEVERLRAELEELNKIPQ